VKKEEADRMQLQIRDGKTFKMLAGWELPVLGDGFVSSGPIGRSWMLIEALRMSLIYIGRIIMPNYGGWLFLKMGMDCQLQ